MANIKPEEQETSLWQGYSLHTPGSNASHHPAYDSNYQPAPLSIPYHGRTQKGTYRSLDIPALQTRPPRDENVTLTASPQSLSTHHSYPSLKRAFQGGNDMTYMEDFREEVPDIKPSMNQDHRLLMFGRLPDKQTIIDDQGRVKHLEITAQIHGMFFLSELATPTGESLHTQPELTCYRRNLFQISGSVNCPRGPLTFISDRGDRIPIMSLDVCVSATESVDGHVVKLIVIPWKTPPPNSPEIPPGQEHEPAPIPLVPFDEGPDANNDFISYPIAYRRLQFRIATANNGRRRELQQHFTLHLNVVGTLANGGKVNVCESSTAPIVVRGRSPRNFQTRKEIPLVGSASSRGHPPELHVATNSMQHPSMQRRATMPKPGVLELPRSPFTFDSSTLAGSPAITRQPTYPTWSAAHTPITPDQQSTAPMTPSYPASAVSLDSYLQTSQPHSSVLASPHTQSPSTNHQNQPPSQVSNSSMTAPPIPNRHQQHQYTYPASVPPPIPGTTSAPPIRFVDHNPRPTKSPRHNIAPPDLPAHTYAEYGARFAPPYNGAASTGPHNAVSPLTNSRTSEYFPIPPPTTMPGWSTSSTSGSEVAGMYGTSNNTGIQSLPPLVMQSGGVGGVGGSHQVQQSQQHYEIPGEGSHGSASTGGAYAKEVGSVHNSQHQQHPQPQQHYTWSQT